MKPSRPLNQRLVQFLQRAAQFNASPAFHPWRWLRRTAPAVVVMSLGASAFAADIKVLTAGAYKPVVVAMQADFERATGHRLTVENDTAGALQKRVAGGEAFDLLIITPAALPALTQAGKVASGGKTLARVAIGVAVKTGAPLPDISTVASFQQTLLAARAVAYIDPAAGGSSGIYLSQLFETWGFAERIKPKAVLVPGGLVAQRLVTGEADLALHQISEILAVPGATLVGPLPAEIQNYTVYAGALSATALAPEAARALLDWLAAPAAAQTLKDKGMLLP
jgi:molybdate transport system substrate-binding protein